MKGLSKLDLIRDPSIRIRRIRKVTVPKDAAKIYIPRKNHYNSNVYGEGNSSLQSFYDFLEPCLVERGNGWNKWHRCRFHQIYIEEQK